MEALKKRSTVNFDRLIAKYSKPGVSDIIDLDKMEVVVDNGHLRNMHKDKRCIPLTSCDHNAVPWEQYLSNPSLKAKLRHENIKENNEAYRVNIDYVRQQLAERNGLSMKQGKSQTQTSAMSSSTEVRTERQETTTRASAARPSAVYDVREEDSEDSRSIVSGYGRLASVASGRTAAGPVYMTKMTELRNEGTARIADWLMGQPGPGPVTKTLGRSARSPVSARSLMAAELAKLPVSNVKRPLFRKHNRFYRKQEEKRLEMERLNAVGGTSVSTCAQQQTLSKIESSSRSTTDPVSGCGLVVSGQTAATQQVVTHAQSVMHSTDMQSTEQTVQNSTRIVQQVTVEDTDSDQELLPTVVVDSDSAHTETVAFGLDRESSTTHSATQSSVLHSEERTVTVSSISRLSTTSTSAVMHDHEDLSAATLESALKADNRRNRISIRELYSLSCTNTVLLSPQGVRGLRSRTASICSSTDSALRSPVGVTAPMETKRMASLSLMKTPTRGKQSTVGSGGRQLALTAPCNKLKRSGGKRATATEKKVKGAAESVSVSMVRGATKLKALTRTPIPFVLPPQKTEKEKQSSKSQPANNEKLLTLADRCKTAVRTPKEKSSPIIVVRPSRTAPAKNKQKDPPKRRASSAVANKEQANTNTPKAPAVSAKQNRIGKPPGSKNKKTPKKVQERKKAAEVEGEVLSWSSPAPKAKAKGRRSTPNPKASATTSALPKRLYESPQTQKNKGKQQKLAKSAPAKEVEPEKRAANKKAASRATRAKGAKRVPLSEKKAAVDEGEQLSSLSPAPEVKAKGRRCTTKPKTAATTSASKRQHTPKPQVAKTPTNKGKQHKLAKSAPSAKRVEPKTRAANRKSASRACKAKGAKRVRLSDSKMECSLVEPSDSTSTHAEADLDGDTALNAHGVAGMMDVSLMHEAARSSADGAETSASVNAEAWLAQCSDQAEEDPQVAQFSRQQSQMERAAKRRNSYNKAGYALHTLHK